MSRKINAKLVDVKGSVGQSRRGEFRVLSIENEVLTLTHTSTTIHLSTSHTLSQSKMA